MPLTNALAEPSMSAAPGATEKLTLPVGGMTCAACSSAVQRALSRQPGVRDANVNLMLKSATVVFDPATISAQGLVDVVRKTGYEAHVPMGDLDDFADQDARDRAAEQEYFDLRRKAILSVAAGAVAMIASMPLMTPAGHAGHQAVAADPFMQWVMRTLDPALRGALPWVYALEPRVLSVLLLVLTLGVMAWAGRHFYTRAWAALRHGSANMNTLVSVGTLAAFFYSAAATTAPDLFLRNGVAPTSTTRP